MKKEKQIEDDIKFVSSFDIITQASTTNSYIFPHKESKQIFHFKPILKRPLQIAEPEQPNEVEIFHFEDFQAHPDSQVYPSMLAQEFETSKMRNQSQSLRSILVRNKRNKGQLNNVHFQLEEDKLIYSDMILGSNNDFALI